MDATIQNLSEAENLSLDGFGELAVALCSSAMNILDDISYREDQAPKPETTEFLKKTRIMLLDCLYNSPMDLLKICECLRKNT